MPYRSVAPEFIAPSIFEIPEPKVVTLSNGARLFFLNIGEQPVIKMEFIFRAGNWFEKATGISFFTSRMLLEGTNSFDSKKIAERLEQYGAFADARSGMDYANLSVHFPTRFFHKISKVVEEVLFCPTFPEEELELMKDIQLKQLSINEKKNSFTASRQFRANLFGDTPYGHVMDELSLRQVCRQDLVQHFNQFMKGRFDVFVTGVFDAKLEDEVVGNFCQQLKSLPEFTVGKGEETPFFDSRTEREESLQSAIYLGKKSIRKDHPDYGKMLLLNEVFGGYFGSRLMQNIREDKGLTYGIYSHLVSLKNDAYVVINSDVKKEKVAQAIAEIEKEIHRMKTELIDVAELQHVKNYLKGSIRNTLTTPFAIAEKLKNLHLYNLGEEFYQDLFAAIDDARSEELLELANLLLFDKPLSKVVVG